MVVVAMTTVRHADLLHRAHVRAHRRFVAMLRQRAYSDPQAPATRLYVEAERLVDALLGEVQWNTAKAALDALQAADLVEAEPLTATHAILDLIGLGDGCVVGPHDLGSPHFDRDRVRR